MTRVLVTADLHLGKGAAYSDDRLGEQEAVWARILELAEEHDCRAILHGGDVFEGPLPTPEHYQAFTRPLRCDPVPIVVVSGNGRHDAAMRSSSALDVVSIEISLSRRPELIEMPSLVVACLPWAPIGRLVASQNGGDRDDVNSMAAQALLKIAENLRHQASQDHPGLPCVLLGHWTVSGWATPTGMDTGAFREVVLPLADVEALGYDAAVFGHVHLGGKISEQPLVLSPGSPLPLDFGEASCDHGVWILDVEPGRAEATFVPIESRRFLTVDLEADEAMALTAGETDFSVRREYADTILKLRYTVTADESRRIEAAALKREALAAGAHRVTVEQTVTREARARVAGMDATDAPLVALDQWISSQNGAVKDGVADGLRAWTARALEGIA